MKNKDIVLSEMYVGAAFQNPCIPVSAPVAGEDGKILGVPGLDVKLGD